MARRTRTYVAFDADSDIHYYRLMQTALSVHVPYGIASLQNAIDNWPAAHVGYQREGKTGAFHYLDSVYG